MMATNSSSSCWAPLASCFFYLVLFCFIASVHCDESWKSCNTIPSLNQTCVTLNLESSPGFVTLNIQLSVNNVPYLNNTILQGNRQRTFCLTQNSLLELMNATPSLETYSDEVNQSISNYGQIPPSEYSLCVALQDVTTDDNGGLTGCTGVDATLMCFDTSCEYKGNVDYGCWELE